MFDIWSKGGALSPDQALTRSESTYLIKPFQWEVGTLLVQALIKHCIEQKVGIVELWTANDGPGRILYEKFGFRKVEIAGEELVAQLTITMRFGCAWR